MESRKYQLQKQIIEALKSNDNDLYSLLKSQWAHRFGVESLEELKNLDLEKENQNLINSKNQKIDLPEQSYPSVDKSFHIEEDFNQEKKVRPNEFNTIKDNNDESIKVKSSQIKVKEGGNNLSKELSNDMRNNLKVEALIPLPPKPKYSYLKKWLLRK